jgi:hypothetical protein
LVSRNDWVDDRKHTNSHIVTEKSIDSFIEISKAIMNQKRPCTAPSKPSTLKTIVSLTALPSLEIQLLESVAPHEFGIDLI